MIKNYFIIIILTLICFSKTDAQMQTAHWFFGNNAGLDFTSGSPITNVNSQILTKEGSTSISDENGNLLFYTDGKRVYDRTHSTMQNGTGLHGHPSSTSSAVVLPKPDDCNLYYIFTIDVQDEEAAMEHWRPKRGIEYNIVDMSLNGGLGAIIQKNIEVPINGIQQGYEKLAAISNANKTGYWVITHFKGNFYTFEVNESGVNLTPVISPSSITTELALGYLKGSPNGSKLAMGMEHPYENETKGSLSLYDFDNASGVVSNEILLYPPGNEDGVGFYAIEFSENSQALYTEALNSMELSPYFNLRKRILQYDLTTSSIADSKYIIRDYRKYEAAMQRGLDGNIYIANPAEYYLDRIENTNTIYDPLTGNAPVYIENAINLGGRISNIGLPTFLNHYFRIAITVDGLSISEEQLYCTAYELDFNFCSQGGEIESIHWDFGDGEESTEFYPQHYYNDPGTYTITLTLIVDGEEYIRTFEITISGPPDIENAEQEICLNEGESHTFDLEESLNDINPNSQNLDITFHLTQGEAENDENPQPTTYTTSTTITIWVRAEDETGCFVIRELNLIVNELPTFTIENPELEICTGSSAELEVTTDAGNEIHWYDSATGTTPIFVGNPFETPILNSNTTYWFEVVSAENCVSERQEISVEIVDSIVPTFDLEEQYCVGNEFIELPSLSENNISGTWNPAQIDTSILGIQTFIFTPDEGQCAEEFPFEIEVTDAIEPIFDLNSEYCESEELITLPTQSDNGITGIWTPSQIDTSVVGILNFTFTPDENQCAEQIPFSVEIFETLVAEFDLIDEYCLGLTPQTLENVSDNGVTGTWLPAQIDTNTVGTTIYTFTPDGICGEDFILEINILDETIPEFNFQTQYCLNSEEITLPTTSNNVISGTWFPAIINTNNLGTTIYEFTPDLECAVPITRSITIVEIILPEFDDLIQNYCLNSDEIQTLPNLSDNGISGAWFPNQINTNIQGTTIYTFTPDDGQCSEDFELNVTVYPHPDMDLEEELLICEGDSFTYTAPDGFDSYQWKNEQNQIISQSQTVTFTQEGIYTLTVEINGIPCDLSRSIEVRFSTPPTITEIKTTENTLTVYATGGNPLEYSMNQVFWQSSPTFTNLQPGIYHVYVRDAKGCSTTAKQAGLLGASNFISPNGDGYNDTWEIRGLEAYPNTRLQIFDRYGKIFVDKILDSSFIWDGKYNSQPLPSGSYWYILILESGEKISGHINIRNY